jgi:hypothetical protein
MNSTYQRSTEEGAWDRVRPIAVLFKVQNLWGYFIGTILRSGRVRWFIRARRDACVAPAAMGETHLVERVARVATPGLREAGIAQRNGHPGLGRSRDCVGQRDACVARMATQGLRGAKD